MAITDDLTFVPSLFAAFFFAEKFCRSFGCLFFFRSIHACMVTLMLVQVQIKRVRKKKGKIDFKPHSVSVAI